MALLTWWDIARLLITSLREVSLNYQTAGDSQDEVETIRKLDAQAQLQCANLSLDERHLLYVSFAQRHHDVPAISRTLLGGRRLPWLRGDIQAVQLGAHLGRSRRIRQPAVGKKLSLPIRLDIPYQ